MQLIDPGAGLEPGLRFAMLISGTGTVRNFQWRDIEQWAPADGFLWVHLERDDPRAKHWLERQSGLDGLVTAALTAEDSRPRVEDVDDALLVVLRGVNHRIATHDAAPDNPDDSDDMVELVPLSIWAETSRCITLRDKAHSLEALHDLRMVMLTGKGPRTVAALLARIAEKVVEHLGNLTSTLEDEVSDLEDQISDGLVGGEARMTITELRRRIVSFRRYMAPQRDALYRLRHDDAPWLDQPAKMRLREVNDKLNRHLDDLEEMRQRATLVHEELGAKVAEQTNRNTFVMSIVSVVMLPVTFVTGYFGMNTGGLPLSAEVPHGTLLATGLIIGVGTATIGGLIYFLRHRR